MLAILFPSFIKLSHVYTHQSHKVCESDGKLKTHFHENDFDCDFYKFKLTNSQFLVIENYDLVSNIEAKRSLFSYYISLTNYQHLSRFVRGPPYTV